MKKVLMIFFPVILLIFFALPAFAVNGQVIITKDNACFDKWYRTVEQDTSKIPATQFVLKKEYFSILLFTRDYQVNPDQTADVEYNIRITGPDGRIYLERQKLRALASDTPNPTPVSLSKDNLTLCFAADDKTGEYIVDVDIKDNIAKKSTHQKASVKLTDFVYQPLFTDIPSLSDWMNSYHKNPSPEKAVDAFIMYAQVMLGERRTAFFPTLAFFLEIFNSHDYLYPSLMNLYDSQNVTAKTCIIYLLRYGNYDPGFLTHKMSKEEYDTYQRLLKENLPDPYGEINNPSQLDILWGIFKGSGSYKPVKKIIDILSLSEYKGCQTKYKTSEKTDEDRQKAIWDTIYQAAFSSLKKNSAQFPLVKDYCAYAYENEELPERVKAELQEILVDS